MHLPVGREIRVAHPDFVAFSPSGRLLIVFHEDEAHSVVDPVLVSDVTVRRHKRRAAAKA